MEVEKQNNEQLRNEESGRKQMLRGLQTPAAVWLPHAHEQQEHVQLRVGQLAVKLEGAEGRRTRAALRVPAFWLRLGLFRVSRIVLKNSLLKLLGVFAFSVPVILFGAAFYQFASGKPFWDGMIHIYGALYKIPGTVVIGEANQATEAVMNLSWLTGSFTFAILLGVVSEDITTYVDGVRKGNIPVEADNHTLVLNWNDDTLPLLRQMSVSRQERDSYQGIVVILADRPKQEMDSDCHHGLAGLGLEVDTRTGVPYSVDDLKKVAAGSARTVLLLNDKRCEDAGKQQAAAVLGVQACRCDLKPRAGRYLHRQSIAVQEAEDASDSHMMEYAQSLAGFSPQQMQLTLLGGRRDVSALAAQSAIQPGVASVYCSIVQQAEGTSAFYLRSFKEVNGLSFGQARRAFNGVVICGYIREQHGQAQAVLSPPDRDVLQADDQLIALAKHANFHPKVEAAGSFLFPPAYGGAEALKRVRDSADPGIPGDIKLVIAWFNHDLTDLADALVAFAPSGSRVTVICANKLQGLPKEESRGPIQFHLLQGDPTKSAMLTEAGIEEADSLIVGGIEKPDHKQADTIMLAMLMALQDACLKGKRRNSKPLHVVGEIRRQETVQVANHLLERLGQGHVTAELLQPDELVSGMMAQIAAEPNMAALLTDFIYSSEGRDLGLRSPADYAIDPEEPCSFELLSELCRLRNHTALGYIADGSVKLNPLAKATRKFHEDDRVIVLSKG